MLLVKEKKKWNFKDKGRGEAWVKNGAVPIDIRRNKTFYNKLLNDLLKKKTTKVIPIEKSVKHCLI